MDASETLKHVGHSVHWHACPCFLLRIRFFPNPKPQFSQRNTVSTVWQNWIWWIDVDRAINFSASRLANRKPMRSFWGQTGAPPIVASAHIGLACEPCCHPTNPNQGLVGWEPLILVHPVAQFGPRNKVIAFGLCVFWGTPFLVV